MLFTSSVLYIAAAQRQPHHNKIVSHTAAVFAWVRSVLETKGKKGRERQLVRSEHNQHRQDGKSVEGQQEGGVVLHS